MTKSIKLRLSSLALVLLLLLSFIVPVSVEAVETYTGKLSGTTLLKLDSSGNTVEKKELSVGDSYNLVEEQNNYSNALDASKSINSVSKRPVGTYYIYKIADGMFNLSLSKTAPGGWVNLSESQNNILAQDGFTQVVTAPTEPFVTPNQPEVTPSEPVVNTQSYDGYVNTENGLIVRDRIAGNKIDILDYNTVVKVTTTTSQYWYKVDYSGKTGYVAKNFITLGQLPVVEIAQGYVSAQSGIVVRSSKGGAIIGRLPFNTFVKGEFDGAWVKFTYNGKTGYIGALFLSENSLVQTIDGYVTAKSGIVVRSSKGGTIIGRLPFNTYVKGILDGAWVKFTYNGKTAYAAASFIGEKAELSIPAGTKRGFVSSTNLQMRLAPSSTGQKAGILSQGAYINGKLVNNGYWIEFSHYGKTKYVAAALVEKQSLASGWITKGNFRYYIDSSTLEPAKGFKQISGKTYFFDPMMRYMYKGVKNTGTNIYYFGSDGVLSSGYKTLRGTTHTQNITFGSPSAYELSNSHLSSDERVYLGIAAINTSFEAIGTKYYWYGTDLYNGAYCSGLAYRAYIENGLKIPGPEYGTEAGARLAGPQSGPTYRGWGPVGDYGYKMVVAQYNLTDDYTGGSTLSRNADYSNLLPGDLMFAQDPYMTHLPATHTMLYAGKINGVHQTMHAGFAGNLLEPISVVTNIWGYPVRTQVQRPFK